MIQIKPKNFVVDGLELYLLKMAVEGPRVPLVCKLAAPLFILMNWYQSVTFWTAARQVHERYAKAWTDLLSDSTEEARQALISYEVGSAAVQQIVRDEFSKPASRTRIILWLVVIALVIVGSFVLLGQ